MKEQEKKNLEDQRGYCSQPYVVSRGYNENARIFIFIVCDTIYRNIVVFG